MATKATSPAVNSFRPPLSAKIPTRGSKQRVPKPHAEKLAPTSTVLKLTELM